MPTCLNLELLPDLSDPRTCQFLGLIYPSPMASDNDLTSMTVSLPTTQKDYVKEQAMASGCSTPSEYIRRLIHADQKAREQEDLERKILEGLDSPARQMNDADWKDLRTTLKAKLRKRKKAQ
jgi:antitoxin ParD1/3/4